MKKKSQIKQLVTRAFQSQHFFLNIVPDTSEIYLKLIDWKRFFQFQVFKIRSDLPEHIQLIIDCLNLV